MASHEAAHINHARRPPAQTGFGSAFSFLCEFLEIIFCELRNSST